jgi:hypothetical protein
MATATLASVRQLNSNSKSCTGGCRNNSLQHPPVQLLELTSLLNRFYIVPQYILPAVVVEGSVVGHGHEHAVRKLWV